MNATEKSSTVKCKTAIEKDAAQVETALTIHWDDDAALREFARRGVVIAWQNMIRATGEIPADAEVKISELAKRERGGFALAPTAKNATRIMAKLDDTQYADALRSMGVAPRDIARLVANRVNVSVIPAPVKSKSGPVTVTKVPAKK